jgi:hypothetical protein
VNLSWLTVYPSEAERLWPPPKPMMIWATVFYLYNFLVMFAVMVIANEDYGKLVTVTKVGLGCALAIELGAVALHGPGGFRGTGTFNNPNQLGYWALLVTGVWLVMKGTDRLNRVDAGALGAALYLVVLSLSKAAMFSTLLLIVTAVALQRTSTRLTAVVGVVVVTLITVVAVFPDRTSRAIAEMTSEGLVARLEHRLGNLGGENDDSLAGRGYDRLWENPQYLVFGAGEGAIWRFATSGRAMRMEIHSTFGALAFNYGIVGLSLFFALMTAVFRGALFRHVLYAGPLFLYGLTHQGLRDTLLWIFFGLVVASTHERRAGKRIAMSQTGNVAYRGAL